MKRDVVTVHWYPLFLVGVVVCGVDTVYVFLILLRSCFLVWSCSSENFVVVSAGWDIRVGAEHGVRWCAWCICVLIVFCFVSSSLFFESYGIMRLLFVFVTESLILAQDERWRRA